MKAIEIKKIEKSHKEAFLEATNESKHFHNPWIQAPLTDSKFDYFFNRSTQKNHRTYLVFCEDKVAGLISLNEIVLGLFQSAYLGYYAMVNYSRKGIIERGLRQVITEVFETKFLHRLEANIQPQNTKSVNLIKKLGFRNEGYSPRYLYLNNQWCDHERWAITSEEWKY